MRKIGSVLSVNSSVYRGKTKEPIGRGYMEHGYGLRGDGHVGDWHRQVSMLSVMSMELLDEEQRVTFDDNYVENLTIEGERLSEFRAGTVIRVGEAWLEITEVGLPFERELADHTARELVMHKEGVFAIVLESGWVQVGDFVFVDSE